MDPDCAVGKGGGRRVCGLGGRLLLALCLQAAVLRAATGQPVTFLRRLAPPVHNLRAAVRATEEAPDSAQARFVLEHQDASSYVELVLRLNGATLGRHVGGRTEGPRHHVGPVLRRGHTVHLLLKRRRDSLTVYVDGRQLMSVLQPVAPRAQVGFVATAPHVEIAGTSVQPIGPIAFADDFMRAEGERGEWREVAGEWAVAGVALPDFSSNPFCYRARGPTALALTGHWFWEDYRFTVAARYARGTPAAMGLVCSSRADREFVLFRWRSGRLELVTVTGSTETVLAERPCGLEPDQWYELCLYVHGGRVACFLDGSHVFTANSPSPGHGEAGLWAAGGGTVLFDDAVVESVTGLGPPELGQRTPVVRNTFATDAAMQEWSRPAVEARACVADYTFHAAPTDWFAAAGEWGVQSRWVCQPRWTWFGGKSRRAAIVWHKHEFTGDVTVDVYASFAMDSPFDPAYRHPGDVNITICGDGKNLSSGYSFVFAGWGNRWSRLLRGGRVLAETREHLLPDNRDRFHYKNFHTSWVHTSIARHGNVVECSVGGRLVLSAQDDGTPPNGGRVAIWTWDNPLLIARARITADTMSSPGVPEADAARAPAAGKARLRFTNDRPGTAFHMPLPLDGVDLAASPQLVFRYRASPGLLANVYVETVGQLHCLAFSAPGVRCDNIPLVASFAVPVLDGAWHTARLDVGTALSQAYADVPGLPVTQAFLGLLSDDPYIECGFGGNEWGAFCEIEGVLAEPGAAAAKRTGAAVLAAGHGGTGTELPPTADVLCVDTFESDLGQWETYGGADGATLRRDRWHSARGRYCLELTNRKLGGSFGARIRHEPYAPRRYPYLGFDYRVDAALRVDLLVEINGNEWRTIKFTDYDDTWPVIGVVPGVEADRAWHHAEVDLLSLLREASLGEGYVTDLLFASCGYPGNEAGLSYRIDNFAIHASGRPGQDSDRVGPAVSLVSPGPGARSGGGTVSAMITDDGSGVDAASIRLTVNGREYDVFSKAAGYAEGRLTWDVRRTGQAMDGFANGAAVECGLRASDHAGNALRPPMVWTWHFDAALDRTPPEPPYAVHVPSRRLVRHTFEEAHHDWGDWGSCEVTLSRSSSATGRGCLVLRNLRPRGGSFLALADLRSVRIEEFPYLSLDVRVPEPRPGEPLDFVLHKLYFDGKRDTRGPLGVCRIETGTAAWQHIEVDMRRTNTAEAHDPYGVLVGDNTTGVVRPGFALEVDNFAVFSRRESSVTFEWSRPQDASGIVGYSWVLDEREDTVPPPEVCGSGPSVRFEEAAAGVWWFHVRALDGAGNWGGPGHCRAVIEQ